MEQSLLHRRAGTYFLMALVCLLALWVAACPFVSRYRRDAFVLERAGSFLGGKVPGFLSVQEVAASQYDLIWCPGPVEGLDETSVTFTCREADAEGLKALIKANGFYEPSFAELGSSRSLALPTSETTGTLHMHQYSTTGEPLVGSLVVRRLASSDFEVVLFLDGRIPNPPQR